MKALCLIYAIVVTLLAVRPCCTDSSCIALNKQVTAKTANIPAKADSDCAGCSPFFSCGSCSGFVLNQQAGTALALPSVNISKSFTPYCPSYLKDVHSPIWQPPQLS